MKREDIIRMAQEAEIDCDTEGDIWGSTNGALLRFAALVAEDCAKVADQAEPYQSADLIRSRWQA